MWFMFLVANVAICLMVLKDRYDYLRIRFALMALMQKAGRGESAEFTILKNRCGKIGARAALWAMATGLWAALAFGEYTGAPGQLAALGVCYVAVVLFYALREPEEDGLGHYITVLRYGGLSPEKDPYERMAEYVLEIKEGKKGK